jgi:Flp pilus assembly protein TadB
VHILRGLLLVSVAITVYLLLHRYYVLKQISKFKTKISYITDKKNRFLRKRIIKRFNIKTAIARCALITFFGINGILNYNSAVYGLTFSIVGFFIPDIFIKLVKKFEKREILNDLLNVTECLKMQTSSQIPIKFALRTIPEVCKNKKLAVILTNLSIQYELSKFDLGKALEELKNTFSYQEIHIFSSALLQQARLGNADEAFYNVIEILREKYIDYLEENTNSKIILMTLGVIVILVNLAVMTSFPIIMEVNQNLSKMMS